MFILPQTTPQLPVIPDCRACGADLQCKYPKQTWDKGHRKTVILVSGIDSDIPNSLHFANHPGLKAMLNRVNVTDIGQFAFIPATACHNAGEGAWKHCLPLFAKQIKECNPEKIIVFGKEALQAIVKWQWGDDCGLYDRWYGHKIPSRTLNAWICPVGFARRKFNADVSAIWAVRGLRDAMRIQGRPFSGEIPDYRKQMTLSYSPDTTESLIREAMESRISAFDYETTGLKPEHPNQRLVSCAIAWVQDTGIPHCVAFSVTPETTGLLKEYLVSRVPKIAANMKFEHRWSRQKIGVEVRNWCLDTVITAHIENPTKTSVGLKFQAFARLGVPYFASEVEPYFHSDGPGEINQIHRVPINKLLEYNAMDSLVELDLGILQMHENKLTTKYYSKNLEFLLCPNPK